MLKASKRPFIYVGGGAIISGASDELREFAKKVDSMLSTLTTHIYKQ